jgi:hypothetical protein
MSKFFRGVAIVFFLTGTLVSSSENAFAQSGPTPNKKALVGSWIETVTFPPEFGRPPLTGLVTFHGDGTMQNSDSGSVTVDPPLVATSGHGAWRHLQRRTFAYTQRELFSDLNGNLTGHLKVRGIYTVSESGNEYTGTSFAEVFDADGNLLASVEVTNAAERIIVELP